MARKYTDVQATRDIRRAEELVARQQGREPTDDARAVRDRADSAGVSLHAAALAVLASDPVIPRQATVRDRPATTGPARVLDALGMERLCVAARSVLQRMPDLSGAAETDPAGLTSHTEVLADLDRVVALPPAEVTAHATVVRDTLAAIGSEQSLAIAVWFDDVLGREAAAPAPAPAGP